MLTVDDRESTTRSSDDKEKQLTTVSDGNVSGGGSDGMSRIVSTTSALDSSVDLLTKQSNAESDAPNDAGSDLTTTTYENSLKDIKLNLSLDFDLGDLNEEEKKNLEGIGNAYGLDVSFFQRRRYGSSTARTGSNQFT